MTDHVSTPQPTTRPGSSSRSLLKRGKWIVACVLLAIVILSSWTKVWTFVPNTLASQALHQRDLKAAEHWIGLAEWGSNRSAETAFLRARWNRRKGDLNQMKASLAKAHQLGAPKQQLEREQWLALAQMGQLREVEIQLPRLLENPGSDVHEICEAYTSGYVRQHRYGDALKILDAWLADEPRHAYAHMLRGRVLLFLARPHDAEKNLREAISLEPKLTEAHFELGQVLLKTNRGEEAIQTLQTCRKMEGLGEQAAILEAAAHKMVGHVDEARSILESVLRTNPDCVNATEELGLLELEAGNAKQAVVQLQKTVDMDTTRNEARYGLAQALTMSGRHAEAAVQTKRFEEVKGLIERIAVLSEESQAQPGNVSIRFELGKTLIQAGQREEGIGWLNSVIELNPRHSETHRLLAKTYEELSKNDVRYTELARHHKTVIEQLSPSRQTP